MLIIDGYNIINQWQELDKLQKRSLSLAREHLIRLIQNFCDFSGEPAVIVFDGMGLPEDNFIDNDVTGRLRVIFSRRSECADGIICRLVKQHNNKQEIKVASNDRALCNFVFGLGAIDITAARLKDLLNNINNYYEN
ncbi:MAG: NYN domain-containing protein [Candidatus Omnitrophota bacterium]